MTDYSPNQLFGFKIQLIQDLIGNYDKNYVENNDEKIRLVMDKYHQELNIDNHPDAISNAMVNFKSEKATEPILRILMQKLHYPVHIRHSADEPYYSVIGLEPIAQAPWKDRDDLPISRPYNADGTCCTQRNIEQIMCEVIEDFEPIIVGHINKDFNWYDVEPARR